MKRVTGIGGIFFKARDPSALSAWYRDHLGLDVADWGGAVFDWGGPDSAEGMTTWSPFQHDTTYLDPGTASFMVNFRVHDLHALLAALRAEGCNVQDGTEESGQGKFGWVIDPEGNKVELWEPPHRTLPSGGDDQVGAAHGVEVSIARQRNQPAVEGGRHAPMRAGELARWPASPRRCRGSRLRSGAGIARPCRPHCDARHATFGSQLNALEALSGASVVQVGPPVLQVDEPMARQYCGAGL